MHLKSGPMGGVAFPEGGGGGGGTYKYFTFTLMGGVAFPEGENLQKTQDSHILYIYANYIKRI